MDTLFDRVTAWNQAFNDIPRKILIIISVVVCCLLAVNILPYCWPFVLAMLFSSLMEPVARLLRKVFGKIKAARLLATLLCILVLFGFLTGAVITFADRIIREALALIADLPGMAQQAYDFITKWVTELYTEYSYILPESFMEIASTFLRGLYEDVLTLVKNLTGKVAVGTITTATSLPYIILAIILTIMGTFYMSYDRERIFNYFRRVFPTRVVKQFGLIKNGIFTAIFGQIRAQLFISFVLMLIIMAGLMMLGKSYAILLGLLIAICDVMPVLGAGLCLNTWAIVDLITGNYPSALGLFVIYLCCVVTRQTIEPRIVGKQLGLYPLVTMMSMFAGFQMIGPIGLIAGPLVANVCRVALDADAGRLDHENPSRIPLGRWLKDLKNQLFHKK